MQNNILEVRDFSVSFDTPAGEVQAVRELSFELRQGEIIAIVGESVCGKSVSTQGLLKLLPSPPARYKSGAILYQGTDIFPYKRRQLSKIKGAEISYVFQDPMTSLNPTMKVGKQITECIRKHEKVSMAEAKAHAVELLRMTGIPSPEKRFNQYPHEMSGGMRQRCMIAIAISCKPKLLIAGEPPTALDVTIQSQILEDLKRLNKEINMSMILITHDLGIVAGMAERVLVLYGGKVVESGSVREIYKNPRHPYTKALLRSVPRLDIDTQKELDYIIGTPPNMLNPPAGCAFAPRCKYCMEICRQQMPEKTVQESHETACWLMDPRAGDLMERIDREEAAHGEQ